jgi:hypothetical protein
VAILHPATPYELYNLRAFDGSSDDIDHRLGDNQDIVSNWWKVGVEPHAGRKRVVLVERSSLAVAFIDGDGVHFGRVVAPTAEEVGEVVKRHGLRWE